MSHVIKIETFKNGGFYYLLSSCCLLRTTNKRNATLFPTHDLANSELNDIRIKLNRKMLDAQIENITA